MFSRLRGQSSTSRNVVVVVVIVLKTTEVGLDVISIYYRIRSRLACEKNPQMGTDLFVVRGRLMTHWHLPKTWVSRRNLKRLAYSS